MTIETTVNKTIQSGNGSNKDFDFAFEIPDEDSLSLTKRGSDGTETAITTNFTVTGIGDEAGGTVNYPTSGSALAANEKIIIKRVVALKQPENLRNQGDYSLEDIEDALDRAVMLCQQLQEQIDRSLKLPLTSSSTYVTVDDFVANRLLVVSADGQSIEMSSAEYGSIDAYLSTLVAIADDISTVAGISSNVTTVAGISSAVSNVSSISSAVSTVSGISAAVSTVASISSAVSSVSSNATNINTVAGIAAAVTSVAAISANVSTVAGISADVTTVAGMSSSIASVVANMTSIQNAASFGFPTVSGGDVGKLLKVNAGANGYDFITQTQIANLKNPRGFRAYKTSNQSITNDIWTKVALDTETFDTDNWFDSTTNYRFTPQVAGYYQVTVGTFFNSLTNRFILAIYKNGSSTSEASQNNTGDSGATHTDIIYMNGSTDYLEFYVYHFSSGARDIVGGSIVTKMSAILLG